MSSQQTLYLNSVSPSQCSSHPLQLNWSHSISTPTRGWSNICQSLQRFFRSIDLVEPESGCLMYITYILWTSQVQFHLDNRPKKRCKQVIVPAGMGRDFDKGCNVKQVNQQVLGWLANNNVALGNFCHKDDRDYSGLQ